MALGLESVYGDSEIGSDGLTNKERQFQRDSVAYDKMVDETTLKQFSTISLSDFNEHDVDENGELVNKVAPANASTIQSRNAAAALSGAHSSSRVRARPASSVRRPRARLDSVFLPSHKPKAPPANPVPDTTRSSSAVARSRTTLGYFKGRNVATTLNRRAPGVSTKQASCAGNLSPQTYMDLCGPPPLGSEMWIRCKTAGCLDDEAKGSESAEHDTELPLLGEDEDAQSFQLAL